MQERSTELAEDGKMAVGTKMQTCWLSADQIEPAHLYDLGRLFKYHNHPLSPEFTSLCTQSLHDHTARSCDSCLLALRLIAQITRWFAFGPCVGYMIMMEFRRFCVG
jgi:hypothetical protein